MALLSTQAPHVGDLVKMLKLSFVCYLVQLMPCVEAGDLIAQPPVFTSRNGELNVTIALQFSVVTLAPGFSIATRTYNGSIPGPTLNVLPGDTLRITVVNQLRGNSTKTQTPSSQHRRRLVRCTRENCTTLMGGGGFHAPNTTNLHTHGLHVSSAMGSDNVLDVVIGPGQEYQYTYRIPLDHMAGTYWYHPHSEGASALQTMGGCAGVIIIRDPPREWGRGVPQFMYHVPEQLLVIQQTPMAALAGITQYSNDSLFRVVEDANHVLPARWWSTTSENNQHGVGASGSSFNASLIDNVALVNGLYRPIVSLIAGRWERVRILNAGGLFFLDLTLSGCELQLVAIDGMYLLQAPRTVDHVILAPASRADVLVRCHEQGTFTLASGAKQGASEQWISDMYWNPVIASVVVAPPYTGNGDGTDEELPHFEVNRPYYARDLRDIKQKDVLNFTFGFQDVMLVDNATSRKARQIYELNGDDSGTCTFNNLTFKKGQPLLKIPLNSVQQWAVTGVQAHPLHVHINPMQIQVFTRNGASTTEQCDREYAYYCVGDFIDTLQIPDAVGMAGAVVRYRVADYVDVDEVLHCHYFVHEDEGCLAYAAIVP